MNNLTLFLAFALVTGAFAQQPEYLQHFDPAKGFKPAQANLTEIILQIAGSLEATGSPEGYLRHMEMEHKRVSALFEQKMGNPHTSRVPTHMTEAYIDRMVKNWNTLSPPLHLDAFAKEIGRCAREGIMGTRLSGTLAVQIFNEHQKLVAVKMRGERGAEVGFELLRARLTQDLEFGKKEVDTSGYETSRRDAVSYAMVICDKFGRMDDAINEAVKPEKATQIKQSLGEWFLDLGYMAQSELEIGVLESALKQLAAQ